MKIGIIGPGRIGGNIARQAVRAGHEVILSFARDLAALHALAADLGASAVVGTPVQAVVEADITILSVPWRVVDTALAEAGSLAERIIVDTTNQGSEAHPSGFPTAAAYNASRMPGARYLKSFNTLTAAFQAAVADRGPDARVVQWIAGDDAQAVEILASLVRDLGYAPVELGGIEDCGVMESPRRPGAVYGEEYRLAEALAVVEAVRAGRPIAATPTYS